MKCNKDTLNTPYKAGLTSGIDTGTAIISMGSVNYGVIFYLPDGGAATAPYICKKTNGTWGEWTCLTTNADIASKSTNLTPGGGYTVLSWFGCFAVISGGSCYLQIGLTSTTPTITSSKSIICTLPTQYRPVRKYIQHTDWGDFVVDTDGTIYIGNTTSSLLHNKNITINAAFLT